MKLLEFKARQLVHAQSKVVLQLACKKCLVYDVYENHFGVIFVLLTYLINLKLSLGTRVNATIYPVPKTGNDANH